MFRFPSIREYCGVYGIKLRNSNGNDVTERELAMEEMYSNSYTVDRLLFVMEFGPKPTERMTIDAVAEKLDMSRTSVERFIKIGYQMGWVHERQERINPNTKKGIFSYRRKKTGEMDKSDADRFSLMRSTTMRLLRQNGTSLAAAGRLYREMEKKANLTKVRSGISKSDLDAENSGGWRYFVTTQ
jgi:hypothetical protein